MWRIYYRVKNWFKRTWVSLLFRKDWEAYMGKMRLTTPHLGWTNVRSDISATDSALTRSTKKWANLPAHAWSIPQGMNAMEMRFRCSKNDGGDADGLTGGFSIYLCRKNSDFTFVGSVSIECGQMEATNVDGSGYTTYYAELITVTDKWMKELRDDAANITNEMARIGFDVLGYDRLILVATSVLATSIWHVDVSGV